MPNNNTMDWGTIALLIAQYGLPFAERVWEKWQKGDAPTATDWTELGALAAQMSKGRMLAAITRAGMDPNSDQAKALLNAAAG